jgi:hypothetical protein
MHFMVKTLVIFLAALTATLPEKLFGIPVNQSYSKPFLLGRDQVPIALTVQGTQDFKAICTSNKGVKYWATLNKMFKCTKSGVSAPIFPNFSFTNITSIAGSRDGFKKFTQRITEMSGRLSIMLSSRMK